MDGRSLDEILREGPLSATRAVDLAVQLLAGLQAVHERGLVHRDLRPADILVSSIPGSDGSVHDFARIRDLGHSRPGAGTPGYMAPEQYGDAGDADARADLYAVAAVLYELLSGRRPFPEPTAAQVRSEPAPPLRSVAPEVPPLLAEVVDRGLARDRDARWSNAQAFARALRSAGRTPLADPVAATQGILDTQPSPPPGRFSRPVAVEGTTMRSRRMRRLLRIAVVLGIAAGFGSGATFAVVLLRDRAAPPVPAPALRIPAVIRDEPAPRSEPQSQPEREPEPPPEPLVGATAGAPAPVLPLPPAPPPSSRPPPPPAPAPKSRATPRTRIDSLRQVGTLDQNALDLLADRALPTIVKRCTVASGSATVEVHLHVHPPGRITLARQAPDDPGDKDLAQCVANRFTAAVPPDWNPGEGASGIVVVKVTVVAARAAARR